MEEKIKVFVIKDQSSVEFFKENILGFNSNIESRNRIDITDVYNLLKDKIYIRKGFCGDTVNQIRLELKDKSMFSDKELVNIYLYDVCGYDDMSNELVLIDFRIELIDV